MRYSIVIAFTIQVLVAPVGEAAIQGKCSNCHTMHNSQNGNVNHAPYKYLTRMDCLGCHAQAGVESIVGIGADKIPQVYHTGGKDLAGGNFAYTNMIAGGGENSTGCFTCHSDKD